MKNFRSAASFHQIQVRVPMKQFAPARCFVVAGAARMVTAEGSTTSCHDKEHDIGKMLRLAGNHSRAAMGPFKPSRMLHRQQRAEAANDIDSLKKTVKAHLESNNEGKLNSDKLTVNHHKKGVLSASAELEGNTEGTAYIVTHV